MKGWTNLLAKLLQVFLGLWGVQCGCEVLQDMVSCVGEQHTFDEGDGSNCALDVKHNRSGLLLVGVNHLLALGGVVAICSAIDEFVYILELTRGLPEGRARDCQSP